MKRRMLILLIFIITMHLFIFKITLKRGNGGRYESEMYQSRI